MNMRCQKELRIPKNRQYKFWEASEKGEKKTQHIDRQTGAVIDYEYTKTNEE